MLSIAASIDAGTRKSLEGCPVILVALDAEEKSAPHIQGWLNTFRHAKPWIVTSAKDPGDFCQAGGDLFQWIEDGLPPKPLHKSSVSPSQDVVKPEEPVTQPQSLPHQDGQSSSALAQTGGGGKDNISGVVVNLSDGSELYVLPEQNAEFHDLRKAGHRVVTGQDLHHIKMAIATEKEENRLAAANLAIDALEIFGGTTIIGRSGADTHGEGA